MGDFGSISDSELKDAYEALRLEYVACQDIDEASRMYDELHEMNSEITNRMNVAWVRENPDPPPTRHREHGWYLPNNG